MWVYIDEGERYPDYCMYHVEFSGNHEVSAEFFKEYEAVVAAYKSMQEKLRKLYESPK